MPMMNPKKKIGLRPCLSANPAPIGMKNNDVSVSDIVRPAVSRCVKSRT